MTKAHSGNIMGLQGDFILPVAFEDKLFSFNWHTSSRDIHPTLDISTMVPDSKFGAALAVEDVTTNVLGSASDGITGWSISPGGLTMTNLGNGYIEVKVTDNTQFTTWGSEYRIYLTPSTFEGKTFTFSVDEAIVDGAGTNNVKLFLQDYDGSSYSSNTFSFSDGKYLKPYITRTFRTGLQNALISIRFNPSTPNGARIIFKNPQVEQKDYPTAWTPGTRSTGRVQYPKEIFPTQDFTLNMWLNHTGDTRTANNAMKLFTLDQDVTKSRLTLWNYCPISSDINNRRIIADFGNNAQGSRQWKDLLDPILFVPGQWEMLTVTFNYSTKTFTFYRNGKLWSSYTVAQVNDINAVELYNSGWKYSNLLICPRVVPDYEIKVWAEYGKPFYDAYDYTAVYG